MPLGPGDFHPNMTPLDVAFGELAVREAPPGSNRGPRVDYYQQLVGLPVPSDPDAPGHAWCVAFMHYCFRATGRWFPRTASVVRFADLANNHRLPTGKRPKQGDVGVHFSRSSPGKGHIVMLNLDKGDAMEDISGNTDPKGSRNGLGVFLVTRPVSYYDAWFRL